MIIGEFSRISHSASIVTASRSRHALQVFWIHADAFARSFERALNQGGLNASNFRILARSDSIPNPPLAMSRKLPEDVKATLREALGKLHETAGVDPATIRGYGGKRVDRYVTQFDEAEIDEAFEAIAFVAAAWLALNIRIGRAVTDTATIANDRNTNKHLELTPRMEGSD
jgi:hypothetical protein